ncbi:hypothetical protein C8Q76DRAFT_788699 [Earliella scabrosa]|nr:hypothetical protein C8Q76DRAFT_788699 [Earliella scabrosa]
MTLAYKDIQRKITEKIADSDAIYEPEKGWKEFISGNVTTHTPSGHSSELVNASLSFCGTGVYVLGYLGLENRNPDEEKNHGENTSLRCEVVLPQGSTSTAALPSTGIVNTSELVTLCSITSLPWPSQSQNHTLVVYAQGGKHSPGVYIDYFFISPTISPSSVTVTSSTMPIPSQPQNSPTSTSNPMFSSISSTQSIFTSSLFLQTSPILTSTGGSGNSTMGSPTTAGTRVTAYETLVPTGVAQVSHRVSNGVIIGPVIGCVALLTLILIAYLFWRRLRNGARNLNEVSAIDGTEPALTTWTPEAFSKLSCADAYNTAARRHHTPFEDDSSGTPGTAFGGSPLSISEAGLRLHGKEPSFISQTSAPAPREEHPLVTNVFTPSTSSCYIVHVGIDRLLISTGIEVWGFANYSDMKAPILHRCQVEARNGSHSTILDGPYPGADKKSPLILCSNTSLASDEYTLVVAVGNEPERVKLDKFRIFGGKIVEPFTPPPASSASSSTSQSFSSSSSTSSSDFQTPSPDLITSAASSSSHLDSMNSISLSIVSGAVGFTPDTLPETSVITETSSSSAPAPHPVDTSTTPPLDLPTDRVSAVREPSRTKGGPIAGGIMGGLFLLVFVILLVLCLRRLHGLFRRAPAPPRSSETDRDGSDTSTLDRAPPALTTWRPEFFTRKMSPDADTSTTSSRGYNMHRRTGSADGSYLYEEHSALRQRCSSSMLPLHGSVSPLAGDPERSSIIDKETREDAKSTPHSSSTNLSPSLPLSRVP